MKMRQIVAFALLAITVACAVNPATGRREFMLVSEQQEIQMGREADPQITAAYGLVDDPELQEYVSRIGQRMARISERPDLPWSFKVVDEPVVNAFALPGGFIYVTRGILTHFDSEAELAGVLGHEIGHVTARHSASQMSRQQLQQVAVVGGMIVSETFREYGGIAVAGLQLMNLSYSRDDELQSDRLGLRYMTRVGYDPDALVGVFEMLASVSGSAEGGRVPEWQLTHPYPENRSQQIRQEMEATGVSEDGTVARDDYLNMIDGMVFGSNPRNGYFEGSRFLHPDLAFEMTFPTGWQTINQNQMVAAVSPQENAVTMLTLAPDATSAEAALDAFLRADGVRGSGRSSGSAAGGISLVRSNFEVTTDNGQLRGEVAFLDYGDNVYRLLGYASSADWSQWASAVRGTINSFAPVTDQRILGVQPMRLDIVTLSQPMSLNSYVQQNPQPVDVAVLARINRTDPGAVLSAGRRIKTVVGQRVGS
ncbi:MAG: M48 family metalloprotease [Longimicrobiales bacterium]|nr:M48 family metalloprotease [Longimicrobiales bacterium]